MRYRGVLWTVIVVLILWLIAFAAWHIAPLSLSRMLTDQAKVKVHVNYLSFTPWAITLKDIEVDNPPGSILEKALVVKKISAEAFCTHYFKEPVVIKELEINGIHLGLEFDTPTGASGNWTRIMKNLTQDPGPKGNGKEKSKVIFIEKLVLKNIDVDLVFRQGNQKVKKLRPIKEIILHNVSTEGSDLGLALANSILGQMLQNVFLKENLNNMLKDLLQTPGSTLDKILSPFQKILP